MASLTIKIISADQLGLTARVSYHLDGLDLGESMVDPVSLMGLTGSVEEACQLVGREFERQVD